VTHYLPELPPATESTHQVTLYRQSRDGDQYVLWQRCDGWSMATDSIRDECIDAATTAGGPDTKAGRAAYAEMAARFTAFEEKHTITRLTIPVMVRSGRAHLTVPS
jgi:hypothetical protein